MSSTILGENIRYFMYKYGICMSDWNKRISVLNHKILSHVLKETSIDHMCTGIAIRDLCDARDSNVQIFLNNNYITVIDLLCTE